MIKISKMYKLSGGTNWRNHCKNCKNLLNSKKHKYCARYPGNEIWSENYVACKYFQENNLSENEQISIFDIL